MTHLTNIERHILSQQQLHPEATGVFSGLLTDIAFAAKVIAREMRYAGLNTILGAAESQNVHGETQQKLDVFADEVLMRICGQSGRLRAIASEESEAVVTPESGASGKYVLVYDPLDGSSNIDANVSAGTIFAIYRGAGTRYSEADILQPGRAVAAAGYIIYGPRTMFVYSTGQGVYGFTLDPSLGEFLLTHEHFQMPEKPDFYAVNQGRERNWTEGVKNYVHWLQGIYDDKQPPLAARYTGSLVMDFHRILLHGGVYLYPGDKKDRSGKLRLVYECAPLAFIAEQAGGAATDGIRRILDIVPSRLHQRIPLFIGDHRTVDQVAYFMQKYDEEWVSAYRESW
jgi:fructose-1,6-bisphosphatase I